MATSKSSLLMIVPMTTTWISSVAIHADLYGLQNVRGLQLPVMKAPDLPTEKYSFSSMPTACCLRTPLQSPMRRTVTLDDIGKSALYLCSDLASGVTGEVVHVDCGYHAVTVPPPPDDAQG